MKVKHRLTLYISFFSGSRLRLLRLYLRYQLLLMLCLH